MLSTKDAFVETNLLSLLNPDMPPEGSLGDPPVDQGPVTGLCGPLYGTDEAAGGAVKGQGDGGGQRCAGDSQALFLPVVPCTALGACPGCPSTGVCAPAAGQWC